MDTCRVGGPEQSGEEKKVTRGSLALRATSTGSARTPPSGFRATTFCVAQIMRRKGPAGVSSFSRGSAGAVTASACWAPSNPGASARRVTLPGAATRRWSGAGPWASVGGAVAQSGSPKKATPAPVSWRPPSNEVVLPAASSARSVSGPAQRPASTVVGESSKARRTATPWQSVSFSPETPSQSTSSCPPPRT